MSSYLQKIGRIRAQLASEGAAGAVPWATVSGRIGGSAIAAAAVNALARPGI